MQYRTGQTLPFSSAVFVWIAELKDHFSNTKTFQKQAQIKRGVETEMFQEVRKMELLPSSLYTVIYREMVQRSRTKRNPLPGCHLLNNECVCMPGKLLL